MLNKHIMQETLLTDKSYLDGAIKMILGMDKMLLIHTQIIVHFIFYVQILIKMTGLFSKVIMQAYHTLELILFSKNAKIHLKITIRANLHNKFKHF